jgi:hypothetical protein
MGKKIFFFFIQKLGVFRPVCNQEECNNGDGDSCEAFNDEDPEVGLVRKYRRECIHLPSPTSISAEFVHLDECKGKKLQKVSVRGRNMAYIGTYTTKSPCNQGGREEENQSFLQFKPLVVHSNEVGTS